MKKLVLLLALTLSFSVGSYGQTLFKIGQVDTASAGAAGIVSKGRLATNLSGYQKLLSITNTGASGVATLITGTLNIPAYTFAGLAGYATTATAAGTTTLTVLSAYEQYFTGATTQIVQLPVASTLTTGTSYLVVNSSTGAVTVNSSGSNAVLIIVPGTSAVITCVLASGTTAASWQYNYDGHIVATGKSLTVSNSLILAGTDGSTLNIGAGGTLGSNAYTSTTYVPSTISVNGKALSANITLGLASSDFANQGTIHGIYHGNAAGNPAFSAVDLASTDITGLLADANISSAANWNIAYSNRITSITTTGSSGVATLAGNVLNIPNYAGLASSNFVASETPSGLVNSSNTAYTLANTPVSGTVLLYKNGQRLSVTTDYTISSGTITMLVAPVTLDSILADYRK